MSVEAGYPEEWRTRLRAASVQIEELRAMQFALVAQAIRAGATWTAIGHCLGCSRQAAQQRYARVARLIRREMRQAA